MGAHEVRLPIPWLHRPRQTCFLDKVCIHQTDEEKKKQGIAGLAALLCASDEILLMHSDVYLRRLWTVYELATVLVLKPKVRLTLWPLDLALVALIGNSLLLAFVVLELLQKLFWVEGITLEATRTLMFAFAPQLLWTIVCRHWERTQRRLKDDVHNFSVKQAVCAVESDRVLVESNVVAFMRGQGMVKPCASDDEALNAFDALVRKRLLPKVLSCFGTNGLQYKTALFFCFSATVLPRFDHFAQNAVDDASLQHIVVGAVSSAALFFCGGPLALALTCKLTRLSLDVASVWEPVASLGMGLLSGSVTSVGYLLWRLLTEAAGSHDYKFNPTFVALHSSMTCLAALLTYWVYGPRSGVAEEVGDLDSGELSANAAEHAR
eukprot:NODE_749_length_1377_cov_262.998487.p1 GENE.NODE_749_length_1377_cov_262.998487~~NODE_749_length_1377_cov_262.998487.p1  ORF type:complete len:379 (-),score=113.05 NODE_749_length_1377_cov_262.998487:223-1359(-)